MWSQQIAEQNNYNKDRWLIKLRTVKIRDWMFLLLKIFGQMKSPSSLMIACIRNSDNEYTFQFFLSLMISHLYEWNTWWGNNQTCWSPCPNSPNPLTSPHVPGMSYHFSCTIIFKILFDLVSKASCLGLVVQMVSVLLFHSEDTIRSSTSPD